MVVQEHLVKHFGIEAASYKGPDFVAFGLGSSNIVWDRFIAKMAVLVVYIVPAGRYDIDTGNWWQNRHIYRSVLAVLPDKIYFFCLSCIEPQATKCE